MNATCEKMKTLGTIGQWGKSMLEVNVVSWNGGKPKLDIRAWTNDMSSCSKGIRLTDEEAEKLMHVLERYFKEQ